MRTYFAAITGMLLAFPCLSASAAMLTINTNISGGVSLDGADQTGATPVDPAGTAWNDLGADVASENLVDSFGVPTGIGVSLTDAGGNALPNFAFTGAGGVHEGDDLLDSYMVATNNYTPLVGPIEFAFTGLDPTQVYNFYFATQGNEAGQGAAITLGGATTSATGTGPTGPLVEGVNYVSFRGVTPSESTLPWTLDVAPGGDDRFASLAGFQIQVVPEPSAACLMVSATALAFLAGTPRRRRV